MNEIKCPNCGKVFQVDEAGYAAIVSQVRNEQFDQELSARTASLRREMDAAREKQLAELSAARDRQLADLSAARERDLFEKDQEILRLKESARSADTREQLAVQTAVQQKETEIVSLRDQIRLEKQAAEIREQGLKEAHKTEVARLEAEVEQYRDFKMRQSTKMIGESLEQQ